jgi:hypothetical protein
MRGLELVPKLLVWLPPSTFAKATVDRRSFSEGGLAEECVATTSSG